MLCVELILELVSVSEFPWSSFYILVIECYLQVWCSFPFLLKVLFVFSIGCPRDGLEFILVWTSMVQTFSVDESSS